MQTLRMSRPAVVVASLILFMVVAAACFAQNVPQNNSTANPPASGATLPQPLVAEPEADTDSADIPPFARGRISEEEYFALRDQEIRTRRGIDDLLRHPQARSQAVRTMEFQEKVLRLVPQGLTPFSALIPAAPVATWTPIGPAPIPNGQTSPSEVAVSGRVTAIAVDPTNANTVYVGTAQGGVYLSTDGGASWTPLLDTAQSLAIGAITIDPNTPTTVFVGTGEGNLSGDSFFGVGLYIIRTATTTPVVTGPFNSNGATDVFTGRAITKIIVNPSDSNKILVSTASGVSGLSGDSFNILPVRGVFLSTNAQAATPTFTRLQVQTGPTAQDRSITDMVMDPGSINTILVYVFGNASPGDGGEWTSAGDPWAGTATWNQNITRSGFGKFAVNRSGAGPTTTFALVQDETVTCGATASSQGTLKTSVDGTNWTPVPAANGFCGGQCFYDMVPAFHPDDVNIIFLGGPGDGTVGTCTHRAFSRSTNGGVLFAANDALLHADSHALAFAPSNHNIVYVGNDGGIFKSVDAGATWTSVNTNGFNATQFVSLSVHPTDPNFSIGGTQDNGTEFFQPNATWTRADFGDGGYSAIDQSSTDTTNVTMYHTYFNQTNGLIAFARVQTAATATEGNWSVFGCPAQPGLTLNGITCTDAVLFYAPLALGPGNPNTLYFGTDHLYRSADRGNTMAAVSQANFGCCDTQGRNFRVSAIGVSAQNDNVRIVGLTNGKAFATTTGANPMTDVTGGWTAKFIARAVIDPNNSNTAYITLDGYGTPSHVWKTTNLAAGSGSWAASSTGLPDVPVNAFAVDPLNSNYLYAGTDIGVFNSIDAGATWAAYGTGLPRVAVFDLNVQKTSHKVRIGTHGRGAWEIAAAAAFPNTLGLSPSSATPGLGSNVTFTATINKGTGVPVPTGTVTFTEGATLLGSGSVNGSGIATFSTTTLTQGPHLIFSTYSGDSLYTGSTSNTVTVTVGPIVIPPDFSVTIPNGSATIPAGQSATYTISVTPSGGFNSAVSFACTGLPGASSCSFNPTTITPNGSPASTTLTIATTVRTTASAQPLSGITLAAITSFGFLGIVFLGIPSRKRRSLRLAGSLMLILAIMPVVASCGGSGPKPPPVTTGTPAGTFSVTVNSTSGATTHTSVITLVVQ
jgi:hypothetical protein